MSNTQHNPFRIIGAFAPSSRDLAQAMIRFMDRTKGQDILEVGAGTGAITQHVIASMGPRHYVDVVELYPIMADILKKRFSHHERVKVHCADIRSFDSERRYDVLIVGLPFNTMLPSMVKSILDKLVDLSKNGAIMVFFEYKSMQKFVRPLLSKKNRGAFLETRALIENLIGRYQFDEHRVFWNMPPALVHYLKINKEHKHERS